MFGRSVASLFAIPRGEFHSSSTGLLLVRCRFLLAILIAGGLSSWNAAAFGQQRHGKPMPCRLCQSSVTHRHAPHRRSAPVAVRHAAFKKLLNPDETHIHVVDRITGRNVERAEVTVQDENGTFPLRFTDDSGRADFDVARGPIQISVSHRDYADANKSLTNEEVAALGDGIVILLNPAGVELVQRRATDGATENATGIALRESATLSAAAPDDSNMAQSPPMIGANFGGGSSVSMLAHRIPYSFVARGFILGGGPGDPNSTIAFEAGGDVVANDFFSVGIGRDEISPSPAADTFDISEPVPPSDAFTSPGATFDYASGTAVNSSGSFQDGDVWNINYAFSESIQIRLPTNGHVVGRMKIAENTSPLPQDRLFFNYSLFDNVPLAAGGVTVNRFTPGMERTIRNGQSSIDVRFPFATTLESNIVADGPPEFGRLSLGDLQLTYKHLIAQRCRRFVSAGVTVTLPTADDLKVMLRDGKQLILVEHQAVHIMPFLGWVHDRGRFISQGFVQFDVDVSGSPTHVNRYGTGLVPAGKIQDTSFLYVDLSFAYWVHRVKCQCRRRHLTGIAPMLELHYNRSLKRSDVVTSGDFRIGEFLNNEELLTAVLGTTLEFGPRSLFTVGYVAPIGNDSDQQFDGELRAFWNQYF